MQDTLHNPEPPSEPARRSPLTIIIGAIVLAAVLLSFWFLFSVPSARHGSIPPRTVALKMGPSEVEYIKNIQVDNVALSRAENFIHQEVTILNADVMNNGTQPVIAMELTVEFYDQLNQVVLREARGILGSPVIPLAAGEKRTVEISFDHVPSSWNMQAPAIRVTYLLLPKGK